MWEQEQELVVLVAAARDGDEGAWEEIVDRFTPLLVGVLQRYRLNSAELQDIAQTVWLRLIENLGRLVEPRALPAWLVTTAKREAYRSAELARRSYPQDPHEAGWHARLVADDDLDEAIEGAERRAAILASFATLTTRQREVLTLLCQDPPVPYVEVSRRTGVPVGAIGPTRQRALERLRRLPHVQALMAGAGTEKHGSSGGDTDE